MGVIGHLEGSEDKIVHPHHLGCFKEAQCPKCPTKITSFFQLRKIVKLNSEPTDLYSIPLSSAEQRKMCKIWKKGTPVLPVSDLSVALRRRDQPWIDRLLIQFLEMDEKVIPKEVEEVEASFCDAKPDLQSAAYTISNALFARYGITLKLPWFITALRDSIQSGDREELHKLFKIKYPSPSAIEDGQEFASLMQEIFPSQYSLEIFTILLNIVKLPPHIRGIALVAAIKAGNSKTALLFLKGGELPLYYRLQAIDHALSMRWIGIVKSLCNDPSINSTSLEAFLLQEVKEGWSESIDFFSGYQEISKDSLFQALTAAHRRGREEIVDQLLHSKAASTPYRIEEILVEAVSMLETRFIECLFAKGYRFSDDYIEIAIRSALKKGDSDLAILLLLHSKIDSIQRKKVLDLSIIHGSLPIFKMIIDKSVDDPLSPEDVESLLNTVLLTGDISIFDQLLYSYGKKISQDARVEAIRRLIGKNRAYLVPDLLENIHFAETVLKIDTLCLLCDEIIEKEDAGMLRIFAFSFQICEGMMNNVLRAAKILQLFTKNNASDSVAALLKSAANKNYSPTDWASVLQPSLDWAISEGKEEMVDILIQYSHPLN
jgi:hypothetical protein